jgi:hypothetical protein
MSQTLGTEGQRESVYFLTRYVSEPLRHAAVDLQRWQMRSPAQTLGNGERQTRHFLVLGTTVRSGSGFL